MKLLGRLKLWQKLTASSQAMSEQARELDQMMSRYRVGTAEAARRPARPPADQNAYDTPARMSA